MAVTTDFEADLERGLHELFDPYLAEQPRPWRAPARGRAHLRLAGGLGSALAVKLATGAVVAALAAGAGIEAVSTQSLNPVDWGRAVSRQAQSLQPRTATPGAPATGSPASTRPTPAATPVKSSPAVSAPPVSAPPVSVPPVSVPPVSPPALPSVSPIGLPYAKPTALPTIP